MLKIMLVDDEKSVLKGLHHILTRHCPEYSVVSMVQSAVEALQSLKEEQVDVVITDIKMPGMDGIELTKQLHELYPQIFIVVLSGYADFEFVRQTMKSGALDYLLKPCRYQNVLDILRKIEENIAQLHKQHAENAMKRILEGGISGQERLPAQWAEYTDMQMAVITFRGTKDPWFAEHAKEESVHWVEDKYLLDRMLVDGNLVIIFRKADAKSKITRKFYEYRKCALEKGVDTDSATARFSCSPTSLEHAYRTCLEIIDFLQFNELRTVTNDEMYKKYIEQQKRVDFSQYFSSQTLGKYILAGDIEKMKQYIEINFNELYRLDVHLDPIRLKNDVLKELLYLEHYLKDRGLDVYVSKSNKYMNEIKNLNTLRQMLNWLKQFVMSIVMSTNNHDHVPQYIHIVVEFIETHYMEDLSLKMVADVVFLNPWYFSSQFKKYLHVSFSEYLNQVRVRIAKQFLKQKDLKVYQVAEMVGFQDAAYFSTVFKSMEKISPKEYQKIV